MYLLDKYGYCIILFRAYNNNTSNNLTNAPRQDSERFDNLPSLIKSLDLCIG